MCILPGKSTPRSYSHNSHSRLANALFDFKPARQQDTLFNGALNPPQEEYDSNGSMSELHLTRLCRTEPVAPALPCANLVGAASRKKVLRLCGWRPFIPSQ
jgi:hypothetical protein